MLAMVACVVGSLIWGYVAFFHQADPVYLDLTVVQSDERAVPFFDLVFDYAALGDDWSIVDPYVRRRGKSFLRPDRVKNVGPHDLLGFRNHEIPAHPDVVVLGDSQSYGINVDIDSNWPSRLAEILGRSVYNMALPGWGGLSYRYMFERALRLEPRLVVVALYMGNDSLENALMAYSTPYWSDYRPRPEVAFADLETQVRRGDLLEKLRITHDPEIVMPFQVAMRFDVNDPDRLVTTLGYEIQNRVVAEIIELARAQKVRVVFVVLPTKESVYAPLLEQNGIEIGEEYRQLVVNENRFHAQLIDTITETGGTYVDIASPLSQAIAQGDLLYPMDGDGHPSSRGYAKIAEVISTGLPAALPAATDPGFWAREETIPGASSARPSPVASFLEELEAQGFRPSDATISGYLGSVRAERGVDSPVVEGWSFDRQSPSSSTTIAVVVDGRVVRVGQTDGSRRDVEEAFGLGAADQPVNAYRLRLEGICVSLSASEIGVIAISDASRSYRFLPAASAFEIDCSVP
ncbi:MAG: SGNH/GDSL hydrolase family protein [Myxococcota bacterium]|nr:SGNH/GDSL hydrolase family protein [Myxococcota bacterium]